MVGSSPQRPYMLRPLVIQQIVDCFCQSFGIIPKTTETIIAFIAKEAANVSIGMVVVNVGSTMKRFFTNRAASILHTQHSVDVIGRETIPVFPAVAPHFFRMFDIPSCI
jgi:hypothetical protein